MLRHTVDEVSQWMEIAIFFPIENFFSSVRFHNVEEQDSATYVIQYLKKMRSKNIEHISKPEKAPPSGKLHLDCVHERKKNWIGKIVNEQKSGW